MHRDANDDQARGESPAGAITIEQLLERARSGPPVDVGDHADAADAGDEDVGDVEGPLLESFVRAYFRELLATDADTLEVGEAAELVAIARSHLRLGLRRPAGRTSVRLVPRLGDGPSARGSGPRRALMVVTDDAPFLVDTVRMVLDRHRERIRLLVHPVLSVGRDASGLMTSVRTGPVTDPAPGERLEAWTEIELDGGVDRTASTLVAEIAAAVEQVHRVVSDFAAMSDRLLQLAEIDPLLGWLADGNMVLLGSASFTRRDDGSLELRPGTELGGYALGMDPGDPPPTAASAPDGPRLAVTRTEATASIHRSARQTCVSVRDVDGTVHRFVGLLAASAYRQSVFTIPGVGDRARAVLALAEGGEQSHSARSIRNVLESLPRDLVFELDVDRLATLVFDIVGLQERQLVRVFDVPEPVGPRSTVLVFVPRSRFDAAVPALVAGLVGDRYGSGYRDVESLVGTSSLARITCSVRRPPGGAPDLDRLAHAIDTITTPWSERVLTEARRDGVADGPSPDRLELLVEASPADYRATVDPGRAVADLGLVDRVHRGIVELATAIDLDEDDHTVWRLRVARRDQRAPLSTLLPLLTHLGLTALDQHPYRFDLPEHVVHLDDIGVALPDGVTLDSGAADELLATFEALERGEVESDGWNRLVLVAGTTARQAAVVRAYARYLRQIGFPFSQTYLEDTLLRHPRIAHRMIDLFEARFEPEVSDRDAIVREVDAALDEALDDVQSLDDDRICRAFVGLIRATTRTNVFRHRPVMAFKFDPSRIPDLPRPRPMFEIFVCSPRVEGVHLRGGRIARGGLRWSDRREDFRTEVLGLVKAQMVKNAVIVPAGAKGGFVLKRPPADPGDLRTEAVACYREFVGGLLDLTDNVVDGRVVHPERTVVHDGEDPYLVVAADKGTASFSDIANGVAAEYGFWLGDAFASGGSAGYDHKEMGITARGAWESVRRHARVLGIDADRDPITVVGIGDMSGDVFGNGLLRSPHVHLVAAFDHRHVFLDPDPDPAVAFEERRRLFELPRSSWADYDPSKISEGGGVFSRAAKSVPLSPAVRRVLGVADEHLSPPELIRAVLTAPVDLLWNGGIGTYVKASTETHAEVGDRSNDAVRVDASALRCRMIGEGGNLGLTQRARVEYALDGGLVYSDAIDNSAGVDCSDHEVNIKILLGDAIAAGMLPAEERNALLEAMTDEVAELVLDDNRAQTLALVIARHQAFAMVDVHARYLDLLEAEGWLDRSLEDLPSAKEIAERQARGSGLRAPEFAVMIAYTKNADVTELLESDVPDDPALDADLTAYFPRPLQARFPEQIRSHRLRREIVTTRLVNQMVNLSGISFDHRMTEETGASVADVARAWVAVREILAFDRHWESIDDLGTSVPLATQLDLFMDVRRMAERCVLWLLRNRRPPLDIAATAEEFTVPVRWLGDHLRPALVGDMAAAVTALEAERRDAGVPDTIAAASGVWRLLHTGFDLAQISRSAEVPLAGTATAYWHLFDRLDLMWLWEGIGALPRATRWQNQARSALRDDLLSVLAALAATVVTAGGNSVDRSIDAWSAVNERTIARVAAILTEIRRTEAHDLTSLSVALRQLRNLVQTSVTSR